MTPKRLKYKTRNYIYVNLHKIEVNKDLFEIYICITFCLWKLCDQFQYKHDLKQGDDHQNRVENCLGIHTTKCTLCQLQACTYV